ncbi:MAG: DUF1203 domain-containing protein [Bacteroidota bacterium]
MSIRFVALETSIVRALQNGEADANGQTSERQISDGNGIPCRHCLEHVKAGQPYLILAHRPFPEPQPYAEIGPIFLHADACARYQASETVPPMLASPQYLIRGYSAGHRIVYGSGRIVPTVAIPDAAADMFRDARISYIHVRSASNNCYQCRIDRS